jgi:hypothetical protein
VRFVFLSGLLVTTSWTGLLQAAAHPRARLELRREAGAEGCVDARRLTKSVEVRLRRRVFVAADGDLTLQVVLSRQGEAWRALITLADAAGALGRRELTTLAAHCSALDDSLGLVVALLVDTPPERPRAEQAERAEVPPERDGAASSLPPSSPLPSPSPLTSEANEGATSLSLPEDTLAPREPWQFALRASGLGVLGASPGVAAGMSAGVAAKPPRGPWLRLLGEVVLPRSRTTAAGAGAELAAQRLGLDVCAPVWGARAIRLDGCVGQRLGRVSVQGLGFDYNLKTTRAYFGLDAGLDATVPLARYLSLLAGVRLELPLTRDTFAGRSESAENVEIFRAAPLVALANLGVEVEL